MLSLILAAAIPIAPWAHWGMTRDEVAAAAKSNNVSITSTLSHGQHAFSSTHEVAGQRLDELVEFDKDNGELSAVELFSHTAFCDVLPGLLQNTYGPPNQRDVVARGYYYSWRSENTGLFIQANMTRKSITDAYWCTITYTKLPVPGDGGL